MNITIVSPDYSERTFVVRHTICGLGLYALVDYVYDLTNRVYCLEMITPDRQGISKELSKYGDICIFKMEEAASRRFFLSIRDDNNLWDRYIVGDKLIQAHISRLTHTSGNYLEVDKLIIYPFIWPYLSKKDLFALRISSPTINAVITNCRALAHFTGKTHREIQLGILTGELNKAKAWYEKISEEEQMVKKRRIAANEEVEKIEEKIKRV